MKLEDLSLLSLWQCGPNSMYIFLKGDTFKFGISKGKIHVFYFAKGCVSIYWSTREDSINDREKALTKALGGGTLQQVINCSADDNSAATWVDCKSSNFNSMTAGDVLYQRWLSDYLDELLACISILVQVANVSGSHGLLKRDVDGML